MAARVRPFIAAVVSNVNLIRQVAALSRANRLVSWAFLFNMMDICPIQSPA